MVWLAGKELGERSIADGEVVGAIGVWYTAEVLPFQPAPGIAVGRAQGNPVESPVLKAIEPPHGKIPVPLGICAILEEFVVLFDNVALLALALSMKAFILSSEPGLIANTIPS